MRLRSRVSGSVAATVVLGLLAGLGSGFIEQVALTNPEGAFVRWCSGLSARMFSIAVVLFLLAALQWQRVSFGRRLQKLEHEIARLGGGG